VNGPTTIFFLGRGPLYFLMTWLLGGGLALKQLKGFWHNWPVVGKDAFVVKREYPLLSGSIF